MITNKLFPAIGYNEEDGEFYWIIRGKARNVNKAAGCIYNGYRLISQNNRNYLGHRLAWFFYYGYWPINIDHINTIRSDNRIENLREATVSENGFNVKMYSTNKSGVKNIHWDKREVKWRAEIKSNGKRTVKLFADFDEAKIWAKKKRKELHGEFCNDGE